MRGSVFLYFIYTICSAHAAPCLSEGDAAGYRVEHCPKGWVRYNSSKCFKFFSTHLTYGSALQACESLDATLACLASAEEHKFLKNYILLRYKTTAELQHVWLGGEARASRWVWTNSSPFEYASWVYSHGQDWRDGQSIALATHSGNVNDTRGGIPNWGKMFDTPKESSYAYICQKYKTDVRAVIKIKD